MNKKTIVVSILILAGVFGLFWWGRSAQKPPIPGGGVIGTSESKLSASEKLYDFGAISMKNGNVSKVFKVANNTGEDISIVSVITSCMCTTAYLESNGKEMGPFGMSGHGGVVRINETLKPGESRNVRVVFDPNAHGPAGVGSIDRFVSLYDSNGGVVELEIKAVVTP